MKFLLDENVPPTVADAVRSIYLTHEWISAHEDRGTYCGVDDLDLFEVLANHGFQALVTQDKNQLKVPEERAGLVAAGLHWIGFKAKKAGGLRGLSLQSATLISGLSFVIDDWRPEPHAYQLTGVPSDASQRVKIFNL